MIVEATNTKTRYSFIFLGFGMSREQLRTVLDQRMIGMLHLHKKAGYFYTRFMNVHTNRT